MKVLVMARDARLRDAFARALRRAGIAVHLPATRREARVEAAVSPYTCVVLEEADPKEALALVREHRDGAHEVPVLLVVHPDDATLRIDALDHGADAVITAPVHQRELVARVNALSRRRNTLDPSPLEIGELVVDRGRHEIRYRGQVVAMSALQHALLEQLALAGGDAVSRRALLEACWDPHADHASNVLEQQIRRLRKLLRDPSAIETVRGVGYRLATGDGEGDGHGGDR